MGAERLRYLGWKVKCPLCGGRFRSFAPDLWDGQRWHGQAVRCPGCQSLPRHRWLWLYLADRSDVLSGQAVLHVAPEPVVAERLRSAAGDYVSADLEPGRAMVEADLAGLPFEDRRFDLVVCSHVLEHVPDDSAAMRELHRVLRVGGTCLIQTPVNYDQAATYEDPDETDESERLRRFSQVDHVRVFGRDLTKRLAAAGFDVKIEDAQSAGDAAVERYGLRPNAEPLRNDLYVCFRAA